MEDAIREAKLQMAREAIGDCPICLEAILDPPIYQVISGLGNLDCVKASMIWDKFNVAFFYSFGFKLFKLNELSS